MLPREHGAYAQLALPLCAALGASRPSLASVCLVVAACAAFVAHEPALVLLGRRGARAGRESAPVARRWLGCTVAVALSSACAALVLSASSRLWVLLPTTLAACAIAQLLLRRERTLPGELAACGALTCAAVPTAIAGGLGWHDALGLWAVFWAAFSLSTVEVRSIAGHPATRVRRLAVWGAALAALATVGVMRPLLAAAAAPVVVLVLVAVAVPFSGKRLRGLGWGLVAASLVMTVGVVVALRVGP